MAVRKTQYTKGFDAGWKDGSRYALKMVHNWLEARICLADELEELAGSSRVERKDADVSSSHKP